MQLYLHMCACGEVRGQLQLSLLRCHLPCFLNKVLTGWDLPSRLGWLAEEFQGSPYFRLSSAGITIMPSPTMSSFFYMDSED